MDHGNHLYSRNCFILIFKQLSKLHCCLDKQTTLSKAVKGKGSNYLDKQKCINIKFHDPLPFLSCS